MNCPNCGREGNGKFCTGCGTQLRASSPQSASAEEQAGATARLSQEELRQYMATAQQERVSAPSYPPPPRQESMPPPPMQQDGGWNAPQTANYYGSTAVASMGPGTQSTGVYSADSAEMLLRRRIDTDVEVKFSSYILWMLVLSIFTAFIGAIIYGYVTFYKLVNRQSQHFMRQQALWQQIINAQKEYASARGIAQADHSISRAQAILADIQLRERERNPWVHAIIGPILTGIWAFYTMHFLTLGWRRHADMHVELEQAIAGGFRDLGLRNAQLNDVPNIPQRNYWLFLLLSIVTLGLFGFYWMYVVMADGNNHMKHHAFVEDQAVAMLRELVRR